jgi:beta-lactamase superfamily II metal-dependent hydrolase
MLHRVQPEIAVISSTAQAPPAPAALERLQAGGADIWRTDAQGTVTVTLSMNANTPIVTGSRL